MRIRRTNSYLLPLLLVISVSMFSAGCDKGGIPGQQPAQTAAEVPKVTKPVQKQESSARPLATAAISFDFSKKKDPFKPLAIAAPTVKAVGSKSGKLGNLSNLPINSFDVTQFKVIGIITGLKENRAMIVDPNGKSYVIKVGTTVGLNEGRVSRINAASIEVTEQFTDDSGKKRKQVVKLNLPKKQEK